MSIRFPDLQVLLPRTAEAPKALSAPDQANQAYLHAQGIRLAHDKEKRNRAVGDADRSEEAAIRRRRRELERPQRRRRGPLSEGGSGDEGRGRRVDIEV